MSPREVIYCEWCGREMADDEDGILARVGSLPLVICMGCAKKLGLRIPEERAFLCFDHG